MWLARQPIGKLSLEAQVASAGLALACAYSGSDEFEASIIAARRSMGAYGRSQRHVVLGLAAAAAVLLSLLTF
jgi:hypothetical protein